MTNGVIEVRVSLKGRPVREYRFSESVITIGRDPQSNIFLDNPGISRCHAILEREGDEFQVRDHDSSNGTFLNEQQVRQSKLVDGDKLRIGKFLLDLRFREDRRGFAEGDRLPAPSHEGTMVLDSASIERLRQQTRKAEQEAADRPAAVVDGNVLRLRAAPIAQPISSPTPAMPPRGFSAVWWRSQSMGLALGFSVGVLAGMWLAKVLIG